MYKTVRQLGSQTVRQTDSQAVRQSDFDCDSDSVCYKGGGGVILEGLAMIWGEAIHYLK